MSLDREPGPGWTRQTCVNHPNLRWTRKDPRSMVGAISRNPQLMFDGDVTKPELEVHPFATGFNSILHMNRNRYDRYNPSMAIECGDLQSAMDYWMWLQGRYTFECPCPTSDLRYLDEEMN